MEQNTTFEIQVAMPVSTQEEADALKIVAESLDAEFGAYQCNCKYAELFRRGNILYLYFLTSDMVIDGESIVLKTYNLTLFKALAAMRTEGWGKGELVRCTINNFGSPAGQHFREGGIYEVKESDKELVRVFADEKGLPNGMHEGFFRKLTADEIIAHYSKGEAEQVETEVLPEQTEAPLTYGGDIADFPVEIVNAMLDEQERQGNKRDVTVFESLSNVPHSKGGFRWSGSQEGLIFWDKVINNKNFAYFFARYPKAEERQDKSDTKSSLINIPVSAYETIQTELSNTAIQLEHAEKNLAYMNVKLSEVSLSHQEVKTEHDRLFTKQQELKNFLEQCNHPS